MNSEELGKGIQELKLNHKDNEQTQLQFTCFTELVNDVNLHFQIIRFPKQVFPCFFNWVTCKLGFLIKVIIFLIIPFKNMSFCDR